MSDPATDANETRRAHAPSSATDHRSAVRKSAFGRSQLFLPSSTTIVREVKCMGGVERHETANVYHIVPPARARADVACWHCCDPVGDACVPVPRAYDIHEQTYHVMGTTCGPACAKAYILEHTSFDRSQHLNVLVRMLRDVYGLTAPVVEAPPRAALKRFGGTLEVARHPRVRARLFEPPFVSYCMIAEESLAGAPSPDDMQIEAEDPEALDEPRPPALYHEFLKTAVGKSRSPSPPRRPRAPQPASSSQPTNGPMAKFLRTTKRT